MTLAATLRCGNHADREIDPANVSADLAWLSGGMLTDSPQRRGGAEKKAARHHTRRRRRSGIANSSTPNVAGSGRKTIVTGCASLLSMNAVVPGSLVARTADSNSM